MSFDVRWTDEAIVTFNKNLEYINRKWGKQTSIKFIARVEAVICTITDNPKYIRYIRAEMV